MTLILFSGPRDCIDRQQIGDALRDEQTTAATSTDPRARVMALMHGACPKRLVAGQWGSADFIASSFAKNLRWLDLPYPASEHPTCPARNRAMVTACIAYRNRGTIVRTVIYLAPCTLDRDCRRTDLPDLHPTHGTLHLLTLAKAAGFPIRRIFHPDCPAEWRPKGSAR